MKFNKIAFIASNSKEAQKALKELSKIYNNIGVENADVIVALGGDGLLLNVIETYGIKKIPIYGMNRGTIGFLMNTYSKENLIERINDAVLTKISPLVMEAIDIDEKKYKGIAINEVSLLRQSRMTAKVVITPAVAVSMYLSAATVSKSASPVPIRPKLPTIIGVIKVG